MSTPMPNNAYDANNINTYPGTPDTSLVESLCGGGLLYQVPAEAPVVTASAHPIASRADGALWDITSGVFVSIQNTNAGTTTFPKNGQ
jgi:hypothetical protein